MTGPELTTALWLPHYRRVYRGGTMAGGYSRVEVEGWWLWTIRPGLDPFARRDKSCASPWPTMRHPDAAGLLALALAAAREDGAIPVLRDYIEERGWHPRPDPGQGWDVAPGRVIGSLRWP